MSSRIVCQLEEVVKKFPELLLTYKITDLDSRIEDLRTGLAQFALVSHEQVAREMDSKILKPEKYLLVACKRWKGRMLKDILANERVIDFDETDLMTFKYLKKFNLSSLCKPERHFVNSNEALLYLFKAGFGYGVLTQEVAKPYLESGELISLNGGAPLENAIALAWYPRAEMPAYFRAIVTAIK